MIQMTMETQLQGLVDKFNDKMATDEKTRDEIKHLKKTVNIDLDTEKYSFRLEDAVISDFKNEIIENADITVTSSPENLQKMLDGDLRPMRAYITKKIKIEGKIQDLMFLKKFF